MQVDNDVSRRAYIMYEFDTNVEIETIINPGTEIQIKKIAKPIFKFDFHPSVYIFGVDLPDTGLLLEKNQLIFEMFYNPSILTLTNYFSNRIGFSLSDKIENYFQIGFKFNKNENHMKYQDPPGKPIKDQVQELCYFFYYIMYTYNSTYEKLESQRHSDKMFDSLSEHSLTQLINLLEIFKNENKNLMISNPKSITDFLSYMDDFIQMSMANKDKKELVLMLVAMFGVFP
jgi:hypothetical protein